MCVGINIPYMDGMGIYIPQKIVFSKKRLVSSLRAAEGRFHPFVKSTNDRAQREGCGVSQGNPEEAAWCNGAIYGGFRFLKWTQQTHGVFLLEMISTWGVKWGVPPFKETPNVAISGWRIIPGLGEAGSNHGHSQRSRSSFTTLTNHLLPGMILQVGSFCKMLYHLVSFME